MFCGVLYKLRPVCSSQAGILAKLGLLRGVKEMATNAVQAKLAYTGAVDGDEANLARAKVRLVPVIPLCKTSGSGGRRS